MMGIDSSYRLKVIGVKMLVENKYDASCVLYLHDIKLLVNYTFVVLLLYIDGYLS